MIFNFLVVFFYNFSDFIRNILVSKRQVEHGFKMRVWYIFFVTIISFSLRSAPLDFKIAGEAAILLNAESGAILFEQEAYSCQFPASTTKVATALYALSKKQDLNQMMAAEQDSLTTLSQEAKKKTNYDPPYRLEPDGSHIGLKKGEMMSLHDLLGGMLIPSGNDAANVIANALGPTIPVFMAELNIYLKKIGCEKTTFYNPHGLHHPQHQTTAYDLALITKEALKQPVFCELIGQKKYLRPKTNKQAATTLLQTNRLIRPGSFYYSKAIGGKTGYHAKAKKTYIGVARSEERTLIVVLLGYQERNTIFQDAIKLFDAAFNQPKIQRTFLKEGRQSFAHNLPKAACPLQTHLKEPLKLDYYLAEDPEAKCLLYWMIPPLPIQKDQQVGELHLIAKNGSLIKKASLLALGDVSYAWPYSWMANIEGFFGQLSWLWVSLISLFMFGLLFFIWKTSPKEL